MSAVMTLAHDFSSAVRAKGNAYARSRRVRVLTSKPDRAEFSVRGSDYDPYTILLGIVPPGTLQAACSCPYADDGQLCKHIWAALIHAESQGTPVLRSQPTSTRWRDFDELDKELFPDGDTFLEYDVDEDDYDTDEDVFEPMGSQPASRLPSPQPSQPVARWKSALNGCLAQGDGPGLHDSQSATIEYAINVDRSMSASKLVVETFSVRGTSTGEQVAAPFLLNYAEQDRQLSPESQAIVSMLREVDPSFRNNAQPGYNRYAYSGYDGRSHAAIPGFQETAVLQQLCRTGHLRWILSKGASLLAAPVLRWDDGPPYTLRLVGRQDGKKKQWLITAELVRPGAGPDEPAIPLSAAVAVFHESVLLPDRVVRANFRDQQKWVGAFRREERLVVPFADREDFVTAVWGSPRPPELALPPELMLRQETVPPVPRLVVVPAPAGAPPKRLPAHVEFQYGNIALRISNRRAVVIDPAAGTMIPRDIAAERRAVIELQTQGIEPAVRRTDEDPDVRVLRSEFEGIVAGLTEKGWTVVADGRAIRRPGQFRMSVTSGVDWFDLDGTFDFDGTQAKLPALLQAVRDGKNFVVLDDGSQGMLPAEWLKRFGGLSALGEAQDETVRFKPSQAMLLEALLAAQDNSSSDRAFTQFCNRLRSFTGVKTKSAPRSFRGELRDYQKQGLGWLDFLRKFRIGGCLADDMGLGKTIQVLSHLESLRAAQERARAKAVKDGGGEGEEIAARKPSLVIVPKSLVFNWRDEAAKFTPELKVLTYTGIERHASFENIAAADLVVTTYGTLRKDILKLKDIAFDTVILDEAQAIKNAQSDSAKACRLLTSDHRLAMTGTPIENHLGELWSLFEFLNPGMLGRSSAFQSVARETDAASPSVKVLARAIAPYVLRRTKAQVLTELPEKTEQTLTVDLPPKHRKLYNELRDHFRATLSSTIETQGLAQSKIHVLEALLRLRQAACHPGLVDPKRRNEGSAKLDALVEQLEAVVDEGHKVLVFSQFTSLLSLVCKSLTARKIPFEYLDGKTSNRKAGVDRFQTDQKCPVFLISLKAGGHGLNLTEADYVFILDPWWNPAVEAQAIDRAHRMGQTKRVFAYRIIARDTVEEKVLALQQQKRELAEAIISENQSVIRRLTAEDLQLLLS